MNVDEAPEKKRNEKRKVRDVEEEPAEVLPRQRINVKRIRKIEDKISTYDDKTPVPNIMAMSPEERDRFIRTAPNPFGYPAHYWDIYVRERERRNLRGFENLLDITSTRVFTDTAYQIPDKLQIRNHRNVNCIKSEEKFDTSVLENIIFSHDVHMYLRKQGIFYTGNIEEYLDMRYENDEAFGAACREATNNYFMNKYGKPRSELKYTEIDHTDYSKEIDIIDGITKYYRNNVWIPEYEQISINNNTDVYDCILAALRFVLEDLYHYVAVAGGFALSMYIYKNYGYHIGFKDIDLFIHSCTPEIKDEILRRFEVHFGRLICNDNVVVVCIAFSDDIEAPISSKDYTQNIQIIRRLYSCPQEVVAGFDVDCCCILTTLEGRIFVTERGHYAIMNGYNTLNFERMSPSYEYRLLKYRRRGFAIWIPFVDYFRDNAVFYFPTIQKGRGSTIIMRYLGKFFYESKINKKSSEDYMIGNFRNFKASDKLEFKTMNPGEQTINTFHRIFLDDPKEWYPVKPEGTLENFNLNLCDERPVEINSMIPLTPICARNIIKKYMYKNKLKRASPLCTKICYELLQFLYQIDNEITVYDSIPKGVVFGLPGYHVTIEDRDDLNKNRIEFLYPLYVQFTKYASLIMKLMGVEFPLNGINTMLKCGFVYRDYDDEGNAIRSNIDILDESSYEFLKTKKIHGIFALQEYEKYVEENSKIEYKITPHPEAQQVHPTGQTYGFPQPVGASLPGIPHPMQGLQMPFISVNQISQPLPFSSLSQLPLSPGRQSVAESPQFGMMQSPQASPVIAQPVGFNGISASTFTQSGYPSSYGPPASSQAQIRIQKERHCGIEIILPPEFSELHNMIRRCLMYQTYVSEMKDIIEEEMWRLFNTLSDEDKRRIGWKECKKVSKQEALSRHPIMSFEEYFHTNPEITKSVNFYKEDIKYMFKYVSNVDGRYNKNFKFKGGKIYGTEYEIAKIRFHLENDTVLEYPAIDNFIPK